MSDASPSPFETFANKLAGSDGKLTSDEYQKGIRLVAGYIRYKYPTLSHECDDLAGDVMLVVVRRRENGRLLDPEKNPASFLRRLIDWTALDRLRVARHHEPLEFEEEWSAADDRVAQTIDRSMTADLVVRGLAKARMEGDSTAFRVATSFLTAAERSGGAPTQRALAEELGLSQEGVRQALLRFRRYLE